MPANSAKLCPKPIANAVFALTRRSISASESASSWAISRFESRSAVMSNKPLIVKNMAEYSGLPKIPWK